MESQFKELKEMVNSTLTQRKGQEEALELVKTRGMGPHSSVVDPY
jgi:kinesin family protein C1